MTSCLCRAALFCAVFHVAFSANCKNVKATADELNVLEKMDCATAIQTIGIDRKYFNLTADNKLSCLSEKLSLSVQNAEGSITCSCPVGWTDRVFDDDSYPLGVGDVAKSDLPEMRCDIPCSEEFFKILSNDLSDLCTCKAAAGCVFTNRLFRDPKHASDDVIIVIPDDLKMDTRSVSCQESCRDDGKAAFSDIILCEQFGDINACNSDMKKHECAEGEYIEVSGGDKRACKKCTAACAPGWGVVSPCQKWADLKCEQCEIGRYIDPINLQCSSCDTDQVYNQRLQKCVRLHRNILSEKRKACLSGEVYVEYLPHKDKCRACAQNTKRIENTCEPCGNNEYTESIGSTQCLPCLPSHSRGAMHTMCVECKEGFERKIYDMECVKCKEGFIRKKGMPLCIRCADGYQPNEEGNECVVMSPNEACKNDEYFMDGECRACFLPPTPCPAHMHWKCHHCEKDHDFAIAKLRPCDKIFTVWPEMQTRVDFPSIEHYAHMSLNIDGACSKDSDTKRVEETVLFNTLQDFYFTDARPRCEVCCVQNFNFEKLYTSGLWSCSRFQ